MGGRGSKEEEPQEASAGPTPGEPAATAPAKEALRQKVQAKEAAHASDFTIGDEVFTLDSLASFDGVQKPMHMGICGLVVNVSKSENIVVGEGYGKLWAGRDATFAMATLSLKQETANKLDYALSDFTPPQHKALSGWYKHFTHKYPVVGRLQEYEGWDFGSVHREAATLPIPFSSSSETELNKAVSSQAPGPIQAAQLPVEEEDQEEIVYERGDVVVVQGLGNLPHLNGREAKLLDYLPEREKFVLELDDMEEKLLVSPANFYKKTA